jgi:hypothetical protein
MQECKIEWVGPWDTCPHDGTIETTEYTFEIVYNPNPDPALIERIWQLLNEKVKFSRADRRDIWNTFAAQAPHRRHDGRLYSRRARRDFLRNLK